MTEFRIELRAQTQLRRTNEPVTCGVPFPKGLLFDDQTLGMFDEARQQVPLQTRVLDKWSDGSVRWVLCDWQATSRVYRVRLESRPMAPRVKRPKVDAKHWTISVDGLNFACRVPSEAFMSVLADGEQTSQERTVHLNAVDASGAEYHPELLRFTAEESGSLRTSVRIAGRFQSNDQVPWLPFDLRMHWFAGHRTLRCHFTIVNPSKATHPGGLWDLGTGLTTLVKSLSLTIAMTPQPDSTSIIRHSIDANTPLATGDSPLEIYQDSSGGPNWQSTNHINRNRTLPNQFQGYRLKAGDTEQTGLRASPVVALENGDQQLAASIADFWQNFPKAIEADQTSITLSLLPRQYGDVHELQGGEQKTHVFYVSFGRDTVTDEPLAWTRDPLVPVVDPEWVASTGAIPYLTPRSRDAHTGYLQLVDAAIEGDDTFEKKREVIDEYGWRHFGDIYGDHEAVFHRGPTPLVSHYNNQYDAVAGLGYQFLRSGDLRWFRLMSELASHVIDIDIYHTNRDKAAYNHGLFWHTYHYVDADTGTHRSYPKNGRVPPHDKPVPGGGPSNEHNYATGLMLHYYLTGDEASKEAACGLAEWVIDMDDGSKTPFRWLARGCTGLASQSRTPDYHGPGRGAANSISALLDGHRLTGEQKFLDKAEQLIRRCVHPSDNIDRLLTTTHNGQKVVDAENRWFYTMFLQSLGKYLDYKAERGELDESYAYARVSLLHYSRWMADNEYPYLDKPEVLEYPTETWAAQDMRKCEVFQFAFLHAEGTERKRFQERAEFFFQASVKQLQVMPTRTLCRPVVLMLSNGFSRAWHKEHPEAIAPKPAQEAIDFGDRERFVPQKTLAIKQFKQIVVGSGIAFIAFVAWWLLR